MLIFNFECNPLLKAYTLNWILLLRHSKLCWLQSKNIFCEGKKIKRKKKRPHPRTSLVAQRLKHLPAMRATRVQSLGWADTLEKEMATHSSILAWRIPWTEEPGRLESTGSGRLEATGSQRVRHDPTDGSPPGSPIHAIFQARVLEWGAIAFSIHKLHWCINNHWKSFTFKRDQWKC